MNALSAFSSSRAVRVGDAWPGICIRMSGRERRGGRDNGGGMMGVVRYRQEFREKFQAFYTF